MALEDLLNGIDAPAWLLALVMVLVNGILLAHVVEGPVNDTLLDSIIWTSAIVALIVLVKLIAFRRTRWSKVWEWTLVLLVVIDLIAAAIIKLA